MSAHKRVVVNARRPIWVGPWVNFVSAANAYASRIPWSDPSYSPPSEAVRQRIAAADADSLLRWPKRLLTADSLDAVLH